MKNIWIAGVVLAGIIIGSCQKMDAYKDRFQKGKEISYPGILDSVKVMPGDGRVQITGLFISDPKIVKYRIYWNGGLDSLEKSVTRSSGVDTLREIISNLPEGNSSFTIRTFDARGNQSVPVSVSGNVYGSNYKSGIINRGMRSKEFPVPSRLIIDWLEAASNLVSTSVVYDALNGTKKTFLTSNNGAHKDTISDIKPGTNALVLSRYLPEPTSIDTFQVLKADTIKGDPFPPFDRTGWTIMAFSDQEATGEGANNGRVVFAFDNTTGTFWHSRWSAPETPYPHWVSIDMGTPNVIRGVYLLPRTGNATGIPKDGKIEISTDGTTWTAAGTFTVQNSNTAYQKIPLQSPTAATRYVRVTF
ncbi:DUF4998 domain-containing protein [Niabella hibiscisoli]|uniref:DUF4998 domain-containing protein n=1 Tax=Niabella hibiscisoli TaxID=1825928 RepID=UPI001F117DFC|nr:DUF4998 domain-containing protein [Niabella hibiscisoli]MCH5719225.1 discoidin domain-containing protein [Niabella hibiscisoli]